MVVVVAEWESAEAVRSINRSSGSEEGGGRGRESEASRGQMFPVGERQDERGGR